jgi:hypothetical protein
VTARHFELESFAQLALSSGVLSVLLFKITNFFIELFEFVLAVLNLLVGCFNGMTGSCSIVFELGEHLLLVGSL